MDGNSRCGWGVCSLTKPRFVRCSLDIWPPFCRFIGCANSGCNFICVMRTRQSTHEGQTILFSLMKRQWLFIVTYFRTTLFVSVKCVCPHQDPWYKFFFFHFGQKFLFFILTVPFFQKLNIDIIFSNAFIYSHMSFTGFCRFLKSFQSFCLFFARFGSYLPHSFLILFNFIIILNLYFATCKYSTQRGLL